MYSKDKISTALQVYCQCGTVTETVRILGYPTRRALYTWIDNEGNQKSPRKELVNINTAQHPRNPLIAVKMNALHRCFQLGESVKLVSEEIGYARASIYAWRKKYLCGGTVTLMNDKNIQPDTLEEGNAPTLTTEINQLQAQMQNMQLEIDLLKETICILKKDPNINKTPLKNREKTVIVDTLKDRYSLSVLLEKLLLSKSSYYYQKTSFKQEDKYNDIRKKIIKLFYENKGCYGYPRIYGLLKRKRILLSEKIVRRVMQEENLVVKSKRYRKYSSYQGEISLAVLNVLKRNLHADQPNRKWLTDITEFAISAGKICLSSLLDCFDGMLLCWTISTSPDANQVNSMLDQAVSRLREGERPLIHSDRGCHYRWSGWIERMERAGLEHSMSKKGCSLDNSACEGLFGRIKNKVFYNKDFTGVSIQEFIDIPNNYLIWYNEIRIKISLGNMSPWEYRQSLGLAV